MENHLFVSISLWHIGMTHFCDWFFLRNSHKLDTFLCINQSFYCIFKNTSLFLSLFELHFCVAFPSFGILLLLCLSSIYFDRSSLVVVTTPLLLFLLVTPCFCCSSYTIFSNLCALPPSLFFIHIFFRRCCFSVFCFCLAAALLFLATSMAVVVAAAQVNYATLAETTTRQTMRSERASWK